MHRHVATLLALTLLLELGCERLGGRLTIPPGLGRGLSEVDSLKALLLWLSEQSRREADSLQIQVLYELTKKLRYDAPDTAIQLAQELDRLAQRSSYPAARGLSYLSYGEAWLGKARHDSALHYGWAALSFFAEGDPRYRAHAHILLGETYGRLGRYDSLEAHARQAIAIAEAISDKATVAAGHVALGVASYQRGEYEKALEHYQKALAIQEEIRDKRGIIGTYNKIGLVHYARGQYVEALTHYQKSLEIAKQIGDKVNTAVNFNYIGTIHYAHGQYVEALSAHQEALRIWEEIGNKSGLAVSYNNLGNIYTDRRQYSEALATYQKVMDIFKQIGDVRGLATSYNNIGNVYSNQGKYSEALAAHREALSLRQKIGDKAGMAKSYYNIGNVAKAQGRYEEALEAYQQAVKIAEEIGDVYHLTFYYMGIGELLIMQNQPLAGRSYLLKALRLAHQLQSNDRLAATYRALAKNDSILAQSNPLYWQEAYHHLLLHQTYQDSVWNQETIRRIERLQAQYEYERREAELRAQEQQKQEQAAAELRRQKLQRNYALAFAAILMASTATLAYFLRLIRRQKHQLENANHQLKQLNTDLEIANAELKAINHALEEANKLINRQKVELEEKNQEIMDSIRYAERIQRALLPSEAKWRSLLPDSFVLYKPRDIVAGDFYWLEENARYIYLGVADATGHGVPGAFVSLVCIGALNRAVREEGLERPSEILQRVRQLVVSQLTQEGKRVRDGMDIALISFDKHNPFRIRFAGANRPLWLMKEGGELVEVKGTRQPVGYVEEVRAYEEVELEIEDVAMVYAFTDGAVDQLGGEQPRKLMAKGLKEMLLRIYREPVGVQQMQLETFLESWRGVYHQIDDITIVGVRVGAIHRS